MVRLIDGHILDDSIQMDIISIPKMVRLIGAAPNNSLCPNFDFNSKDGAIDRFYKVLWAAFDLHFNSKDGAIDSRPQLNSSWPANDFNSKDGAIDSSLACVAAKSLPNFNSKDGAIDRAALELPG